MKKQPMRDAFFDRIFELAWKDKDIVIVSADLAAPSLDKFREKLPKQFINVGIAEQNAILVATGLALTGKKPLAYAITQFITLRCYEQIRLYPCGMNLPITIVGAGTGTSYWESGPTHQIVEDISAIRALPNIQILNPSDQEMARDFADFALESKSPKFIRLDRDIISDLHAEKIEYKKGFATIGEIFSTNILATGNMTEKALMVKEILKGKNIDIGVIDGFKVPFEIDSFKELCGKMERLVTLEEHTLAGGFGSYILEIANDHEIDIKIKRLGMDLSKGYDKLYNYGGREALRSEFGIDTLQIVNEIIRIVKK